MNFHWRVMKKNLIKNHFFLWKCLSLWEENALYLTNFLSNDARLLWLKQADINAPWNSSLNDRKNHGNAEISFRHSSFLLRHFYDNFLFILFPLCDYEYVSLLYDPCHSLKANANDNNLKSGGKLHLFWLIACYSAEFLS